jgi:3-oxoacyl-[acyl-carrier-protein] synthase II
MTNRKVIITACEAVTAYGCGADKFVDALYSGKSAVRIPDSNADCQFSGFPVAMVSGLAPDRPRVFQLLEQLRQLSHDLPPEVPVLLAVTIGAIDLLEKQINGQDAVRNSHLNQLSELVKQLFGQRRIIVVSGACAASACAIARASSMISNGISPCVAVISCDALSEFIISGFSSLAALDEKPASPFSTERSGLNLGEAATLTLLADSEYAASRNLPVKCEVAGWAMNADAYHVTTPAPSGAPLAEAIRNALGRAEITADEVVCIAAHGTGTFYNDAMEMAAFHKAFSKPVPVFSVKGGTGHTIAPGGALQVIAVIRALQLLETPPNINLNTPMLEAIGWASPVRSCIASGPVVSVSSGFGGINCALILRPMANPLV